jgi:hypothetical protein
LASRAHAADNPFFGRAYRLSLAALEKELDDVAGGKVSWKGGRGVMASLFRCVDLWACACGSYLLNLSAAVRSSTFDRGMVWLYTTWTTHPLPMLGVVGVISLVLGSLMYSFFRTSPGDKAKEE